MCKNVNLINISLKLISISVYTNKLIERNFFKDIRGVTLPCSFISVCVWSSEAAGFLYMFLNLAHCNASFWML